MKLITSEIKAFMALSAPIVPNNIIPILQYVKLENGYLEKTNLKTHIRHKITADSGAKMLLDDKVLAAFLRDCKSSEIDVEVKGKKVTLSEGGKRPMTFQSIPIEDYPKYPDNEKENEVELSSEVLSSLGIAAKNTGNIGGSEVFDFVHCFSSYVIGSDRTKLYISKCGAPDMIIDKETATIVSKFDNATYFSKGNIHFFEMGNTLYGFQMYGDVKTPPVLMNFIPKERPKEWMQFEVSQFVGFCDTVMAASASKVLDCKLRGNKLSFNDVAFDINYEIELDVTGDYKPSINFNAPAMGGYFKSLGLSSAMLAPSHVNNDSLAVFSDEEQTFSGLVIGLKEA